ncbi:MAG: hypothetical protein JWR75_1885 [Devosia sp.]|nr:hypothetical protein [Devosia sp.]
MTHLLLESMIVAAIEASVVINAIYLLPIVAENKADGSPVTEADAAAEAVIITHLKSTGIPFLAEESAVVDQVTGDRFFCVDPLDGTKEFIKRNGEFTVNIALIESGRPTLGVVLAPATGELFAGGPDGAFTALLVEGTLGARTALKVSHGGPLKIVASRSHGHAAMAKFCDVMAVAEDVSIGSSLKFCLLARGEAQLYPRLTPTCEWDTAAGQAVLEAAGGVVITLDGQPLHYGKGGRHLNPFFIAANELPLARRAAAELRTLLPEATLS